MGAMTKTSLSSYGRFLLLIAGLGGLLYGVDVGIIAAALLYLGKTVTLTLSQTSAIVAAVLGGSMLASPLAGALADWRGRKPMMVLSGLMFVGSVGIIVVSQSFLTLFAGPPSPGYEWWGHRRGRPAVPRGELACGCSRPCDRALPVFR